MKVRLGSLQNTQAMRAHGDIAGLKASIREVGLIHPPTVDENLNLLAGRRRYQALLELYGPDHELDVTVLPVNGDRLKAFRVAILENLARKPLTDPEMAAAIKEYDDMKREMEGEALPGGTGGVHHTVVNGQGWTQTQTAQDLGISQQSVAKAIKIATAIEEHPDLSRLGAGHLILERYHLLAAKPLPLPEGKYQVIYADPPWRFWEGCDRASGVHYSTMSLEEIKALPVTALAAADCALFLWGTGATLPGAVEVMEAWGFRYATVGFVWTKSLRDGTGFAFGLGNWTRANAEFCLLGIRGHIPRRDASVAQIIYEPAGRHSVKPAIVRDRIVQLVGDLKRIELFSRQRVAGWDSWGNVSDLAAVER